MALNEFDSLPNYLGANGHAGFSGASTPTERRNRMRCQVHWPVSFVGADGEDAVETITQNLSSEGFYCFSSTSFIPGERLACCLKLPPHDPTGRDQVLWLECQVRVSRVDPPNAGGAFGIACEIEDYHFAHQAA